MDRFVDLQATLPWRRLLDKRTDPIHDVGGAVAVSDDSTESLPDLLDVCRLRVKPAQSSLSASHDRPIGLIDLCAIEATAAPSSRRGLRAPAPSAPPGMPLGFTRRPFRSLRSVKSTTKATPSSRPS